MKPLIDVKKLVGLRGTVKPYDDDSFTHEFDARCIGIRHEFLQVRDMDDNVYDIEVSQFTPDDGTV